MEKLEKQLKLLSLELDNPKTSKARVEKIKNITLDIAKEIDKDLAVPFAYGMITSKYENESKYPRRRVKAVVSLLMDYVN